MRIFLKKTKEFEYYLELEGDSKGGVKICYYRESEPNLIEKKYTRSTVSPINFINDSDMSLGYPQYSFEDATIELSREKLKELLIALMDLAIG